MTAEIAIMNRRGVALAADSAVTASIGGGVKVFPSANKLFTLSKYEPVGIMIYNAADMLGLPWETAVKTYRKELSTRSHSHVQDYAADFLSFLESHSGLFPTDRKESFGVDEIQTTYASIKNTFYDEVKKLLTGQSKLEVEQPDELLATIIDANYEKAKTMRVFELSDGTPWPAEYIRDIEQEHLPTIRRLRDEIFSDLPLDPGHKRRLTEIGKMSLSRTVGATGYTGLVIAGYGTEDYYPSLTAVEVYGNLNGRLRFVHNRSKGTEINADYGSAIVPFAQSEMVTTFMEGVDPSYQETMADAVATALTSVANELLDAFGPVLAGDAGDSVTDTIVRSVLQELYTHLKGERWKHFVSPVLSVVAALPKAELASMAESLVNLTSMKRHVSSMSETVGGPIDVALISKGDGLVWIKRKHYFDKDLNYHFFANYFRRGGMDEATQ